MRNTRELLIPIALLGFALLCYAAIIPTYFLSDDFGLIGKVVRQGMFYTWGESHGGFLRPGTVLSYVADHWIWGLNPIGYHITNILFHALTAYGVFLIARHLFRKAHSTDPVLLAFLAACLFVALPCHSESVTWIAGRTDVIAVALGLAATGSFLLLLETRSLLHASLALVLLAASLLTKESVIVLPAIWCCLFVHDWWSRKERPSTHSAIVMLLSCFLLAGYLVLRKETIGHFIGGYGTTRHISIIHMSSVDNLFRYVFRTFSAALPLRFYGVNDPFALLIAGFTVGVLTTVFIVRWRRSFQVIHWPLVALLTLCYLVSLVPVITMRIQLFDTQNERFLYLPSAFACVLVTYLAAATISHARFRIAALLSLIVFQALSLQWVNQRWITASHLCKQIATEVSQADPATTVVLNVPDNFRGAYVFRSGLQDAATTFMGNPRHSPYRQIAAHDLNFLDEVVEANSDGSNVVLNLPERLRWHGVDAKTKGNSLTLTASEVQDKNADVLTLLSFISGTNRPMLRTIGWRLQNEPRGRGSF